MSAEMEALAHAWDAGWNAASDRAQRVILLAATVGVREAERQIREDGQVSNPYRLGPQDGAS